MQIAIISDIHSNCFALKAVLSDIKNKGIHQLIILGDTFGYYPWAIETYDLLKPFLSTSYCIRGNHDELLLNAKPPHPLPSYWEAARLNEADLASERPEAIQWLKSLNSIMNIEINCKQITMVHGTPDDTCNGRYYPDDEQYYNWFPKKNEILLMGHTHYPIFKISPENGILFNPGSIGQPRDGNPMACWGIFDVQSTIFLIKRTPYDNLSLIANLKAINWDNRAILALNKTKKGNL